MVVITYGVGQISPRNPRPMAVPNNAQLAFHFITIKYSMALFSSNLQFVKERSPNFAKEERIGAD